ncbi:class A beta-lactamase-related serine hydrolase [Rhodanobacter glycinis]|uniref:Class A beta-lactamase-related serine hydrolase n=1 Tax=Rhodanobacter glycinis TaxID=582702 RepID=A0A502BZK0_9GAMM|nr:serine hydrolase domain-containing protein [Rhodanobacter glycinis]TPG04926.1 class A beta-lactamase-related serine hydrolase [Rhodanobacter glycinis]
MAIVRYAAILLALAFTSTNAKASVPSIQPGVTELMHAGVKKDGPGVVVLIRQGQTTIYERAEGLADVELNVPLSTDHVFRIASVTKVFTAALVVKLAKEGKLSLDDPLKKYLPSFPGADRISLRQLLNHTSGIADLTKNPTPGLMRTDSSTSALVDDISKRPPDFPAGSKWAYSNSGYILLAAVIEKVTGTSWHAAIDNQIIAPLGLRHTRYDDDTAIIRGRIPGYSTSDAPPSVSRANFISMSVPSAAGALVSDAADLATTIRRLAHGDVIGSEGYSQMVAPVRGVPGVSTARSYGLGLYVWTIRGEQAVGHTGQIDGFASALAYLPKQDITIVVLANDDNFDAQTLMRRVIAVALGRPFPKVSAVAIPEATLAALKGDYETADHRAMSLVEKDGALFYARKGHSLLPLQMTANGDLHFVPDDLGILRPMRDASGKFSLLNVPDGENVSDTFSRSK